MSCSELLFKDFNVDSSFLLNGNAYANFSAEIDPASARQFFLFSKNDTPIEGNLIAVGNQIIFTPIEEITENNSYKIQVFAGTKDIMGNTLQFDYCNEILLKKDFTCPFVKSINFYDNSLNIVFNKKIDKKSFNDNFSIIPQKDFVCIWNEKENAVSLSFHEKNMHNKNFSIKIQKGLRDCSFNEMENDFLWDWRMREKASATQIEFLGKKCGDNTFSVIENIFANADLAEGIQIRFNNQINSDTLLSCLECEPEIPFKIEPELSTEGKYCKSATIIFMSYPKWNKDFNLIARPGIQDINGNNISEKSIIVKNNSEAKRPPEIIFMAIKNQAGWILADKNDNWKNISFPLTDYPEGVEKKLPVRFIFSISGMSKQIDRLSAMEALDVQCNSCASMRFVNIESISENDFDENDDFIKNNLIKEKILEIKSNDKKIAMIKCEASFRNRLQDEKPAYGIIEFRIGNEIKDNQKNYMEEEALFSFNKN